MTKLKNPEIQNDVLLDEFEQLDNDVSFEDNYSEFSDDAFDEKLLDEDFEDAERVDSKRKRLRTTPLQVLKTMFIIGIIAGLLSAIAYSKVQLAAAYGENDELTEQLETLKSENVSMKSSIDSKTGLTVVDDYAEKELGLKKLNSAQIEYVTVDGSNSPEIVNPEKRSVFERIKNWIVRSMEYIGII